MAALRMYDQETRDRAVRMDRDRRRDFPAESALQARRRVGEPVIADVDRDGKAEILVPVETTVAVGEVLARIAADRAEGQLPTGGEAAPQVNAAPADAPAPTRTSTTSLDAPKSGATRSVASQSSRSKPNIRLSRR